MLKTSLLTELLNNATQIVVEYNRVDNSGSHSGNFERKFYLRLWYDSRATHLNAQNKLINELIN